MSEDRETRINALIKALLEKDALLRQYHIWLETSEKNTIYKGEDVYHRLIGVMQALSDVDFIPGVGSQNFVEVITKVQKETGLDLGVCKHLQYHSDKISTCGENERISIGSLTGCLPPQRGGCPYRI